MSKHSGRKFKSGRLRTRNLGMDSWAILNESKDMFRQATQSYVVRQGHGNSMGLRLELQWCRPRDCFKSSKKILKLEQLRMHIRSWRMALECQWMHTQSWMKQAVCCNGSRAKLETI